MEKWENKAGLIVIVMMENVYGSYFEEKGDKEETCVSIRANGAHFNMANL